MVYPHIQYGGPAYTALQSNGLSADTRELHSRTNDGIHVRMLWHVSDGHVSVAVEDTKTGESLDVPVGAGERALDVFHHPYAYAPTPDQRSDGALSDTARAA